MSSRVSFAWFVIALSVLGLILYSMIRDQEKYKVCINAGNQMIEGNCVVGVKR